MVKAIAKTKKVVRKVTEHVKTGEIVLILSAREAAQLKQVLSRVGGPVKRHEYPDNPEVWTVHDMVDNLHSALYYAGVVATEEQSAHSPRSGSLYFN